MLFLMFFAFLAGIVTILSPCILPILPIVLSGSLSGGRWRPLGVVIGFVSSFTFFAVFAFSISQLFGFSTETLRNLSVVLLIIFGASLFSSRLQVLMEEFAVRFMPQSSVRREGLRGGIVLGFSLGFIWTPCVGPILASVLTLAATSSISLELIAIAGAYSLGSALPMLAISYGGKAVLSKLPALRSRSAQIQKIFGVLIFATALLIYFNLDRTFQVAVLDYFPNYGRNLTRFEDNSFVRGKLDALKAGKSTPIISNTVDENDYDVPNRNFSGATKWIDSKPLSFDTSLKGKVVLVDFWTYTCINCIRTLPHLTSWYEKYKDDGLVIVGVHSPEFEFERNEQNVRDAMLKYGITYPVVQDNEFKIWQSYNNQYWPAHYLIDKKGVVRETHFGEGKYEETEAMIRKLLAETGAVVQDSMTEIPDMSPRSRVTFETYLGYDRMERFSSFETIQRDAERVYTVNSILDTHTFGFSGSWTSRKEYSQSGNDARLVMKFDAQNVYLVMSPEKAGSVGEVEVYLDGEKVSAGGEDVVDGKIRVDTDRLYHLIQLPSAGKHTLELRFGNIPVRAFAFTFG